MSDALLFTIGYEGRSASDVLARLKAADVRVLIDVRYRPNSRKPGLAKTGLARACEELGITYVHDRDLGTPPEMLDHVLSGAHYDDRTFAEYRRFLSTKEPSLEAASARVQEGPACLLCFEADASNCHRAVVAEVLAQRTGATVCHL